MKAALFYLLVCGLVGGRAQSDSLPFDRDFRFLDGMYLSWESLQKNQPDQRLFSLDGRIAALPESYSLKVERLYPKGRPDLPIPLQEVYALVYDGIPYRQVGYNAAHQFTEFAGLRVRGRLSYYEYDTIRQESRTITAYVPQTGQPFRQGQVMVEVPYTVRQVIDFTNGNEFVLSRESLLARFMDDPNLQKTVRELPEEGLVEKLYRCLLIYDDRHPLWLPAGVPNAD